MPLDRPFPMPAAQHAPQKWLALDTTTEQLSVAVGVDAPEGGVPRLWEAVEPGGARASSRVIALVFEGLERAGLRLADLDAIAFGAGPGAFTGLRTACAVAQGLGFGAQRPLLPVDSLLALAETARIQMAAPESPLEVLSVLDARMGEFYAGHYRWDGARWQTVQTWPALTGPALAAAIEGSGRRPDWIVGNAVGVAGAEAFLSLWPEGARRSAIPGAAAMVRLAPELCRAGLAVAAEAAEPHYVRDKVAKTTVERQAAGSRR